MKYKVQPVKDSAGHVVGYLETLDTGRTLVRDKKFILLGYTNQNGTFDASGKLLYLGSVPQLLLPR